MHRIHIATVLTLEPEEEDAVEAMGELLGNCIENRNLPGLAGPNELLQFVGNADGWSLFLGALVTALGSSFSAKLGSQAAEELWRRKADIGHALIATPAKPVRKIIEVIQRARAKKNTVSATIPHKINSARNVGLVISDESPGGIVAQLAIFASKARAIEAFLDQAAIVDGGFLSLSKNPDCSTRVELNTAGKIVIPATYQYKDDGRNSYQHVNVVLR